jgi:hypothetical protein
MQVLIVIGLFAYWVYMKKVINLLIDVLDLYLRF